MTIRNLHVTPIHVVIFSAVIMGGDIGESQIENLSSHIECERGISYEWIFVGQLIPASRSWRPSMWRIPISDSCRCVVRLMHLPPIERQNRMYSDLR